MPPETAKLPNTPTRTPIAHAHVMTIHPGVLGLRLVEQHAGNHAVTDKHQQRGADYLSEEHLGDHPPCLSAPTAWALR